MHDGFWHVGLNMLALWMIGRSLEPMLGRGRFLTLYLLSALGGSVAVALLSFTTLGRRRLRSDLRTASEHSS